METNKDIHLHAIYFVWTVYVIEVYTGDKAGAGTDAHVFITLFGKRGQTPKTQLISRLVCSFTPDQLQISFIFQLENSLQFVMLSYYTVLLVLKSGS